MITRPSHHVLGFAELLPAMGSSNAQLGAKDVDDGLPLLDMVLDQAAQRVQPAQPRRCLLETELLNRLGVQVGDAAGDGIFALQLVGPGHADLVLLLCAKPISVERCRRHARYSPNSSPVLAISAVVLLLIGSAGQVAYHLLSAVEVTTAP